MSHLTYLTLGSAFDPISTSFEAKAAKSASQSAEESEKARQATKLAIARSANKAALAKSRVGASWIPLAIAGVAIIGLGAVAVFAINRSRK